MLNWLYQSNDVIGSSQLDARIHVYDGRSWVDRGGGGQGGDEDNANGDRPAVIASSSEEDDRRKNPSLTAMPTTATMSQLLVDKAQMFHSGRYVCSALGASGTWTLVHILAGKKVLSFYI